MARKRAEKVGFKDIVTLAKSGWTPDEVNELLDRMEAMGDLNAPPSIDDETADDHNDSIEDIEESDSGDDIEGLDDEADDSDQDIDNKDTSENLAQIKKTALEVENERLKKDIKRLQAVNKNRDVSSGEDNRSPEDKLIDAFQSCFN